MFKQFIAQLDELAQNHTHDNFIKVQRVQCEIITAHSAGKLTHARFQALYNIANIIRDDMRQTLTDQGILHV